MSTARAQLPQNLPPPPARPDATTAAAAGSHDAVIWLLTAATTLSIGSMYYVQPLLAEIAGSFGVSPLAVGSVPSLAQLGYVAGLLLLTPLGDVLEKRRLIVTLLALSAAALLAAAVAPNVGLFSLFAVAIGLTSVVVQVLIPFVAVLSAPAERAKNLGTVLSGALIGVLLSRTLSGYVGAHLGWRAMLLLASALMLVMAVALRFSLPTHAPQLTVRYPALIRSVWTLFRTLPRLRSIGLVGALMYAALCAFWTPLAFFLERQYGYGPAVAGAFGLIGVMGAVAAKLVGRYVDRFGPRRLVRGSILLMIAAFVVMGLAGGHLVALVAAVLLLDLAAQAATVSNQTEIYGLHGEAQTRLNTIYKMLYFGGGSVGTVASAAAWQRGGWSAVCALGVLLLAAAATVELTLLRRRDARQTL